MKLTHQEIEKRDKQIWEMMQAGLTHEQISQQCELHEATVRKILRKNPHYHSYKDAKIQTQYPILKIKELIREDIPKHEIASRMGYSLSKLKYIFKKYPELQKLFKSSRSIRAYNHDQDREEIYRLFQSGMKITKIGEKINRSNRYIDARLKECGVDKPNRAKIHEYRIDRIKFLKLCGYSISEISSDLGIHPQAIYKYLRES